MTLRFGLVIYWSHEDQAFLVEVPELPGCMADGQSYEEAVANAQVVIEQWIQTARELGRSIPEPQGRSELLQSLSPQEVDFQNKSSKEPIGQLPSRTAKHQLGSSSGTARPQPGSSSGTAGPQPGSPGTAGPQPGSPGTAGPQPGSLSSSSAPPSTSPRGWHSRNYLPHFDAGPAIQHITYRLADALPQGALTRMQAQSEELNLDDSGKAFELRKRIEEYLDAGYGSCVLQEPEIAEIVVQTWMYFDETRYHLLAWVVMPNHVHVLIEPLEGWSLGAIVRSWKSYTGRWISGWLKRHEEERKEKDKEKSQAGAWRSQEICRADAWRSRTGQAGAWRSQEICQAGAWRSRQECQAGAWRSGMERVFSRMNQGRIWQREYWDRFIRTERHYWDVKAYIENNPVKANLVKVPEKWPWSSAAVQKNVYSPW